MKEYFFLKNKDQNGPFTIDQLADKGLTNETLIWTDGMVNWEKLKDIPELTQILKPKSVPPPPPNEFDEKITKTEVSGHLKVTTENTLNPTIEALQPNQTTLTWLIIWCGFHLFALLMSYSQIKMFNNSGEPRTYNFWPLVDYYSYDEYLTSGYPQPNVSYSQEDFTTVKSFLGIFVDYDWSEFAFYVGGAGVIYLLVSLSSKKE